MIQPAPVTDKKWLKFLLALWKISAQTKKQKVVLLAKQSCLSLVKEKKMLWHLLCFVMFSFFKFFSLFQAPGKDSLELFRAIECSHSNWADTAKDSFPILMCVRLLSLLLGHQNKQWLVVWLGLGSKEWCAVAMSWTCTERGLCSCSLLPEASWLYDEKDVLSIDLMTLFSWPESTVHPLCFHF